MNRRRWILGAPFSGVMYWDARLGGVSNWNARLIGATGSMR
jgi:hypothetical protein